MDPQERSGRCPVLEFLALKKPCGRSRIAGLARNVVICGRVRRGKPFVDILFYMCPWEESSVSTTDAIRVGDHKHFTSSTLLFTSTTSCLTSTTSRLTSPMSTDICCIATLVFLAPRRTKSQYDVDDQSIGLRTIFDLSGGLQNLSYRHL